MAKKSDVVGTEPRGILVVDRPKRRIDPAQLAAALGANPSGQPTRGDLDPIALGELGALLLSRLRSSGGRPALADAIVNCRVPLSAEDVHTLESMVAQIGVSAGARPSVGQLASVIVRLHLDTLRSRPDSAALAGVSKQDMQNEPERQTLQQFIDEQINPLREQVKRLESALQAVCARNA